MDKSRMAIASSLANGAPAPEDQQDSPDDEMAEYAAMIEETHQLVKKISDQLDALMNAEQAEQQQSAQGPAVAG